MRWWCSKPQSVTSQSLDSANFIITTFIISPRPTFLSRFLDRFISLLLPPPISSGHFCSTSQLHPIPISFPGQELHPRGSRPHPPPPASSARSAPRAACLHLPSYPASFAPPLPPSSFTQVPVGPWGLSRRRSLRLPCVPPPSPCSAPLPVIFWVLVSLLRCKNGNLHLWENPKTRYPQSCKSTYT